MARNDQTNAPSPPGKGSPPSAPSAVPNLLELIKALKRRWILATILSVALGGLVTAGVWFFLPPPKHVATTVFHVAMVKPSIIENRGASGNEFSVYQQGQKALVTSRLVLNTALRDPKVADLEIVRERTDPVDWFQNELKVDYKLGPEYMRVTLSGDRPEEQLTLLTAVANAYLKEIVHKERNRHLLRLEQLKEISAGFEETLRRKRKSVRELTVAVGSEDPMALAVKQRYAFEVLGQAEKELIEVQSKRRRLGLEIRSQDEKGKQFPQLSVPSELIAQEIDRDPVILQSLAKKEKIEQELTRLVPQATRGKDEPALRPLFQEVASIDAEIEARRKKLQPLVSEQLRERAQRELKITLAQKIEQEEFLKEYEKVLSAEVTRMREQATSLTVGKIDMENFKQEIAQEEKVAERVAGEAETLKVELQAPARVSLLEEAYITREDPLKRRMKIAGMSGGGTLLFILGLIAWLEYRRRQIDSVEQVTHELGLPVVGTVPALPDKRRGESKSADNAYRSWNGALIESVDYTRTHVLHASQTSTIRVVMVTSAMPREGKTSLASHLAASLARAGHRTLLLDGDVRLPSIHRVFNLPLEPGFSELLRGEVVSNEVIKATQLPGLWVMPGGKLDPRALHALAQPTLRSILESMRTQFDFVVVDSAPVLPVVDSLLLGQNVDAVLFSVLSGSSQFPTVHAAWHRLADLNMRLLGVVFSGVDPRGEYGSSYGGYSYASASPYPGSIPGVQPTP